MNNIEAKPLYQATVRRRRRLPVMWALPIIAILIGAWLAWDTLSKEGPRIVVSFENAEGLQIGQSQLKFKDITLGTVNQLEFSKDRGRVLVTIATTSQAETFLTSGTQFWVVKPRLFAGNISGFSTLLSGSYIGMMPGDAAAKPERNFVGREEPPVLETAVPGRTFLLKTDEIGSVSLGSPVFYRGLQVGEVLGWDVGDLAKNVSIHAFVRAPYDTYVHDQARFWNASGVSVKLTGGAVEMQVESLRAVLLGGVAFETPATAPSSQVSAADHEFPLFRSQDAAKAASYSRKVPLLVYFSSWVRGLGPGSEVVAHGLQIGNVTDVQLTFDPTKDSIQAPVRLEVEPERVVGVGRQVFKSTEEMVRFRASLQIGNLLTGEKLVSIDVVPDASAATVTMRDGAFVFPTVDSGGLAGLEASANDLLRGVSAIPFAAIGHNLEAMTKHMNTLTDSPELQTALTASTATLTDTQTLVRKLDAGMGPAAKQLPELAASLQATLKQTNQLMQSVNAGYGGNTQFHRDLDRMMAQLTDAVRSFRALADLLTQHPEALVRGRGNVP